MSGLHCLSRFIGSPANMSFAELVLRPRFSVELHHLVGYALTGSFR